MLLPVLEFKYLAAALDFAFEFELILYLNQKPCFVAFSISQLAHRASYSFSFTSFLTLLDATQAKDVLAPIAHGQVLDDAAANAANILFSSLLVVCDGILSRVLHLSDCLLFSIFNFLLDLFDEVHCLDFSLTIWH